MEQNKKSILKIIKDLVFGVGGLVLMNGVIQLLLYPAINRRLGDETYGDVLSLLAVVSVLATGIGTGANYARMVAQTKGRGNNGDFNRFLLISMIPAAAVSIGGIFLFIGKQSLLFCLLFVLLTWLSILRYYGDVEYRLNVNFVQYFLYYVLISVGYVGGTFLIRGSVFGDGLSWQAAIILGELLSVLFVGITGTVFKGKDVLKRSAEYRANLGSILFLVSTNVINALVLQADKIILNLFEGGEAVTVFYVATLVGKIIAMLTTPLNSIIIGYLTRYKGKFTARFFTVVTAATLGVGVLFTFGALLVSHVFVYLMYPDVYETARQFFFLANAGQVLYFLSGTMMVVVLRFVHERYQLIINGVYAGLYLLAVVPLVWQFGLWGITWGILIVNAIRFLMVVVLGYRKIREMRRAEA